jgi:hypothetical protein
MHPLGKQYKGRDRIRGDEVKAVIGLRLRHVMNEGDATLPLYGNWFAGALFMYEESCLHSVRWKDNRFARMIATGI